MFYIKIFCVKNYFKNGVYWTVKTLNSYGTQFNQFNDQIENKGAVARLKQA